MNCLHRFPSDLPVEFGDSFNDPFRYRPHPLIKAAAEEVLEMVPESDFRQGKMLGVLAVEAPDGLYSGLCVCVSLVSNECTCLMVS